MTSPKITTRRCANCVYWAEHPGPGSEDKPWEYLRLPQRKGECVLTDREHPESTIRIQFYRRVQPNAYEACNTPEEFSAVLVTPGDFECAEHVWATDEEDETDE